MYEESPDQDVNLVAEGANNAFIKSLLFLRDAAYGHFINRFKEPDTSTKIIDSDGTIHFINVDSEGNVHDATGDIILIDQDPDEAVIHIWKQKGEVIIWIGSGLFTIGALIAAVNFAKYRKNRRD